MQFFVAGEYVRVRSSKTDIAWVPIPVFLARTAPATRDYFATFPYSGTPNGVVLTRDQFQSGSGSPLLTLPPSMPLLQQVQYDVPSDVGGGSPQNTLGLVGRVDWVMGTNSHAYIRYAWRDQELLPGTNSHSPYQGFNTGSIGGAHNALLSLTRVWASNVTSQSKIAFSRLSNDQSLSDQGVVPGLYLLSNVTATLGGIHVALPGYLPYSPGSAIPFGGPQTLLQFHHDQTLLKGRHDLRFGGSYARIMDDRTFGAYQESVMTLGSNVSDGMENLMRGQLHQFEGAVDPQGGFPARPSRFQSRHRISRATIDITTTRSTPTTAGEPRKGSPCRSESATSTTACSTTPTRRSTRTSTTALARACRHRSDPERC